MDQILQAKASPLADSQSDFVRMAAKARNLPVTVVRGPDSDTRPRDWFEIVLGGRAFLFSCGVILERDRPGAHPLGRHINEQTLQLFRHKQHTKAFLAERGFSVPFGLAFHRREREAARQAFDRFTGPICVKPTPGRSGFDTFTGIEDRTRYEAALDRVTASNQRFLVEESVVGRQLRFFYIGREVVAIEDARPASVLGDGVATIAELAQARNLERERRHLFSHMPIPLDADTEAFLAAQGLGLTDVPPAAHRIFLRGTSNASTGGDAILCTDEVHPSYAALIAQVCQTVPGLHVTTVDTIVADVSRPAAPGNHWILELNSHPGYGPYCLPWAGEPIDVAGMVLDYLATDYPIDAE